MSSQRIVIIGGGAAGWLTANHLAKAYQESVAASQVSITLIESSNIPTIGVGEGTVPSIRDSLHYFGISETDLLQRCSATFKQSIRFINWQTPQPTSHTHEYHHVFDYPNVRSMAAIEDWVSQGYLTHSFEHSFVAQAHIVDKGLAPKKFVQAEFQGVCNYAYHFDAAQFARLLAENATLKLGVKHRHLDIDVIQKSQSGEIEYLLTDAGEQIEADLFIDCSGARSLLLGESLETPFVSKSDELFTDTALAVQVPLPDKGRPIPGSTLATAHNAGWIWDIGLTERRGVGVVYASQYMSDEQAEKVLRDYLGDACFAALPSAPRKIPMKSGYYQQFWRQNCVAIGMSQGFVEPLEATGLLMFDKSAQLLAQTLCDNQWQLNAVTQPDSAVQQHFNQQLKDVWEGVFDFIKLHYCLSRRTDSPFWLKHQDTSTWSKRLTRLVDAWQHRLPHQDDLPPGVFNLANYLYVLFGMGFRPQLTHKQSIDPADSSVAHHSLAQSLAQQLESELLEHRALLHKVHQHGLQRI